MRGPFVCRRARRNPSRGPGGLSRDVEGVQRVSSAAAGAATCRLPARSAQLHPGVFEQFRELTLRWPTSSLTLMIRGARAGLQKQMASRQARIATLAVIGAFLAAVLLITTAAQAQTKIRVGKAQAQTFAFIPADVGAATGLFKRRGLDVEVSSFAGDARLLQALAADAVDIALGGGPTLAFVAKGAPMLAVAALADAPGTMMVVVLRDGPVKTEDDLKGRTLSVSTAGSLTYWLAQQLSRSHGWGPDGINIATLGASAAQAAALKTNQIDGMVTESSTVFKLEQDGVGRILVRFGDRIKDFHVHVIYASRKLIDPNPHAVRAFLAGGFPPRH